MKKLIILFTVLFALNSCITNKVLSHYNLHPVEEHVKEINTFGYNDNGNLVVNFTGNFLGEKASGKYHFEVDLNAIFKRYNLNGDESVVLLPDGYAAERIYEYDSDFDESTPGILTVEIRKDYIKKGFFEGSLIPLNGKKEIFSQGKKLSLPIEGLKVPLTPYVFQFTPEKPWFARDRELDKVSFVLQPTYNRKEATLLLVPLALAADIGTIIIQAMIWGWAFDRRR